MNRYVCVHGHFYQPPRENPSLEAIELQDSAYPYHDWNERVTAESYAPNAVSRLLDEKGHVSAMVNNYSEISFNFGPTLLSWMEAKAPKVYRAIQEGDQESIANYGGHGSAISQGYNHMILPLANHRDKVTQVKWGVADFRHRFGREPEGMWLPETAVDLETLQVLAENGIKFTILAPSQASRVRARGSRSWKDVSGTRIDPSRSYWVRLPSRGTIDVFFYDGPISHGVAFEGLLNDGKRFARRLLDGFSDARDWPQLSHIATDGESYGHHHRHGEMALTYALHEIEEEHSAQLTNYGQFLEHNPPTHFAEIYQNSSWSCVHGVERWRSNCGCNSGGHGGWNQEWRAPLRAALDWLRDTLAPCFESRGGQLLKDPWRARDEYIRVVLDRSPENVERFLAEHGSHSLNEREKVNALKLLEMQRHAMLMYTSCGWFFDELSGIESVQVIHYAGRAVYLAQEVFGNSLEPEFVNRLRSAKSNISAYADGGEIYQKWVKPAVVDIPRVAAHYAISSIFEPPQAGHNGNGNGKANANCNGKGERIYCYDVKSPDFHADTEGKMKLVTGRAAFSSEITHECVDLTFAALHLGDHNVLCGVRPSDQAKALPELRESMGEALSKADTAEVVRLLHENFGNNTHTLRSLFRDERRKILGMILNDTLEEAAGIYRSIYDSHAQLMRFLIEMNAPVPRGFQIAAEMVLNRQLRKAIAHEPVDEEAVRGLLKEAATVRVQLDATTLEYEMRKRVEKAAAEFAAAPEKREAAEALKAMLELASTVPSEVVLAEAQTVAYVPLVKAEEHWRGEKERGNPDAPGWLELLTALRDKMRL